MARCFVTRDLPGEALERLGADHEVEVWPEALPPTPDELRARAEGLEGLLSLVTEPVDAALIDASKDLRAISNYAVGVDNVDVEAASGRGIPVGHTPGVLTETTADLAFTLILAVARKVVFGDAYVRRGDWQTWEPGGELLGRDVHGATLGVVGFGQIGQAVARRAEGFAMDVLYSDIDRGVALEELLERSDFVTVHSPLTPETKGLIGEQALRRMKQTAYLVNTARGPIVDMHALDRALREGWIAGAGLDVTDPEPVPIDHPLLAAPNLTILPHVGSGSEGTRRAMAEMAVDNLLAGLAGERMPNCVNPEVYER